MLPLHYRWIVNHCRLGGIALLSVKIKTINQCHLFKRILGERWVPTGGLGEGTLDWQINKVKLFKITVPLFASFVINVPFYGE